jgi:hypothetical protein
MGPCALDVGVATDYSIIVKPLTELIAIMHDCESWHEHMTDTETGVEDVKGEWQMVCLEAKAQRRRCLQMAKMISFCEGTHSSLSSELSNRAEKSSPASQLPFRRALFFWLCFCLRLEDGPTMIEVYKMARHKSMLERRACNIQPENIACHVF